VTVSYTDGGVTETATVTGLTVSEPIVERFAVTVKATSGTFYVSGGNASAAFPYNWKIYVDGTLYTTASGTSGNAATITGLGTALHEIAIEPVLDGNGEVPNGWLVPLRGINADTVYCNSKITNKMIAKNATEIADNALKLFFNAAVNLTLGPNFGFAKNCEDFTVAGISFCESAFVDVPNLTALPDGFNLPPNLTSVGSDFCGLMLHGCWGLTALPASLNLPQGLTIVGRQFCHQMFSDCINLIALPAGFNLPQGLTSVENRFCRYMFLQCTKLVINNAFQFVDVFSLSPGNGANAYELAFQKITAPQNRTAASIVNGITPNYGTRAFQGSNFNTSGIDANWL
jgi:hypothetical protein